MAKPSSNPIAEADVTEYLDSQSDFAFELRTHKQLLGHGFKCEHGGAYEDPITGKIREFDLRAEWTKGPERVRLAVECKQIQENFPLVVMRVPRAFDECTHDLLLSVDTRNGRLMLPGGSGAPGQRTVATKIAVHRNRSVYDQREFVGKSCAQFGRDDKGGFVSSNSDAFAKWSQALSSAQDLAERAWADGDNGPYGSQGQFHWLTTLIVPVVVIPNGRLWVADFESDGTRKAPPAQIDRAAYFVNVFRVCGDPLGAVTYNLSHIEFVTVDGLDMLINDLTNDLHGNAYFSRDSVADLLGIEDRQSLAYGW